MTLSKEPSPAPPETVAPTETGSVDLELNPITVATVSMALLAGLWALYVAQPVVLPVVIAFVLRLLLQPVFRQLTRAHLPGRLQRSLPRMHVSDLR